MRSRGGRLANPKTVSSIPKDGGTGPGFNAVNLTENPTRSRRTAEALRTGNPDHRLLVLPHSANETSPINEGEAPRAVTANGIKPHTSNATAPRRACCTKRLMRVFILRRFIGQCSLHAIPRERLTRNFTARPIAIWGPPKESPHRAASPHNALSIGSVAGHWYGRQSRGPSPRKRAIQQEPRRA